ncbi:16S rRNA (cytidine(1402)-2'-O)-methyltransferase [Alkaliphilus serpentinus]|uniref:Ribosomal RNA small subunit methyltransferase I n=1 Tax=Alkaliphilus serpentinus TaxID=1482731 RepID=A0A833HQJ4_9FIRM|nr:16S rRNA (cytidine(1402)-2'-O)-methyltransferase [Alkaliphilus serpentinus]KAB3531815.1 16S rRNA (cytidine(1402)-2'-O)-methyltransferase [Alkaliphilus serpentinus]
MDRGKLFICPTPIGNLEDITLRVLRILKEVDYIAAEDTRHTLKLLNHFEISKPLSSYHEHNKTKKGEAILQDLLQGKTIALVSDAGLPGISDPGADIIKDCVENGIPFEVLPGASAGILALVASGLDTTRFSFEGFIPREKKRRRERLEKIKKDDRTLIFYEAPHRIIDTLKDMMGVLGNRKVALGRELTKKYEEYIRGTAEELLNHFQTHSPKGEFVIVCEGASEEELEVDNHLDITIKEQLQQMIDSGIDKKEAVKEVAKLRRLPKREVYQEAIDL